MSKPDEPGRRAYAAYQARLGSLDEGDVAMYWDALPYDERESWAAVELACAVDPVDAGVQADGSGILDFRGAGGYVVSVPSVPVPDETLAVEGFLRLRRREIKARTKVVWDVYDSRAANLVLGAIERGPSRDIFGDDKGSFHIDQSLEELVGMPISGRTVYSVFKRLRKACRIVYLYGVSRAEHQRAAEIAREARGE